MSAIAWATVEKALQDFVVAGSGLDDAHVIWEDGKPRPTGTYIALWLANVVPFGWDWGELKRNVLVFADDVIESINTGADTLTLTGHVYVTGDGPVKITTSGSLAGSGLTTSALYWIVKIDANTIKLADSFVHARAGVTIDLVGTGTGTHTIIKTTRTIRAGQETIETARGIRRCELQLQCFATPAAGVNAARAVLLELVAASSLSTKAQILKAAGIGFTGFDTVQALPRFTNGTVFEPRATVTCGFYLESLLTETGGNIDTAEVTNLRTGHVFTVSNP